MGARVRGGFEGVAGGVEGWIRVDGWHQVVDTQRALSVVSRIYCVASFPWFRWSPEARGPPSAVRRRRSARLSAAAPHPRPVSSHPVRKLTRSSSARPAPTTATSAQRGAAASGPRTATKMRGECETASRTDNKHTQARTHKGIAHAHSEKVEDEMDCI